jgi:SpoVK/Ycf46/Vps4 family AAA+-type ATPase
MRQAERLVQRMALDDGSVDEGDLSQLARAKADILSEDGVVELVEADVGTLDDVGGLDTLKEWLRVRREAQLRDGGERLDPPRGILLTGIPGAGKSFVAKTLARTWERPLVLLDPARLYSKSLGESESRLRKALDTAEAMAPVVLWIDEIEKGFARTGDGDGGVSARILGTFLRWMQDREGEVFVVATANDVTALPPELARKGRFDEVFFVDVPDDDDRRAIFAGHLERRGIDKGTLDLAALAAATAGFTGAEIETTIVAALYEAVAEGTAVTQDALAAEILQTVPLTVSRNEEIAALRAWADERALHA